MTQFFFPVKIELRPDLVVEISTGNTSEISTEWRWKFAILDENEAKNVDIGPEISTGPKFLKIEKYGISASFCTFN